MNVDFPILDSDTVVVNVLAIDLDSIFVVVAVQKPVVDNMDLFEFVVGVVEMVLIRVHYEL